MTKTQAWLKAFRLRTLPLALTCIGMGTFLAIETTQKFNGLVCSLCVVTTIFLQILSNLANDYGDTMNGADSKDREGPKRAVQLGLISPSTMKSAMILFAVLSLVSASWLIYEGVGFDDPKKWGVFAGLGCLSILAAITYTAGKKPYGYAGLGDLSVMMFFGWVGVVGSFYMYANSLNWLLFLPATSCGALATAVLNVNNIRDIESDKKAGKYSVPVRIGRNKAVIYHYTLLLGAVFFVMIYNVLKPNTVWYEWSFLLSIPLLIINAKAVKTKTKAMDLDPYLKQMAMSSLAFSLLFGIPYIIKFLL